MQFNTFPFDFGDEITIKTPKITKESESGNKNCKKCPRCDKHALSNSAKSCWKCSEPYPEKVVSVKPFDGRGRTCKQCPNSFCPELIRTGHPARARSNRQLRCAHCDTPFVPKSSKKSSKKVRQIQKRKYTTNKQKSRLVRKTSVEAFQESLRVPIDDALTDLDVSEVFSEQEVATTCGIGPMTLSRGNSLTFSGVSSGESSESPGDFEDLEFLHMKEDEFSSVLEPTEDYQLFDFTEFDPILV